MFTWEKAVPEANLHDHVTSLDAVELYEFCGYYGIWTKVINYKNIPSTNTILIV